METYPLGPDERENKTRIALNKRKQPIKKQPTTFKSGTLPRFLRATSIPRLLPALVLLLSIQSSHAGSATWLASPATGDWNTAGNWTASRSGDFTNGVLDFSPNAPPGLTIGSIEGSGAVFLGANNLTVGSNNLSTTSSGVIQDGGINGGTGGAPCFNGQAFPVGTNPVYLDTADYNRDGNPDIATANYAANSVSVLLGNGDGTFQAAIDQQSGGTGPQDVTSGDFNGDGNPDLAVINNGSNNVSVLLGVGDGTFGPPVSYPLSTRAPQRVEVGDFNEDGNLDLATADYGPDYSQGAASILLGNGDGSFQPATDYPANTNPVALGVGDFNNDGHLDLAVGNNNSGTLDMSILFGNGLGGFSAPRQYSLGGWTPRGPTVGDFNGDGNLDIAAANYELPSGVSVLLGRGDGTFRSVEFYPLGAAPSDIAAGDFNGDGHLDLVVPRGGGYASTEISIFMGNGDGTFQDPVEQSVGDVPLGVAIADFNLDGRPDIAVTLNVDNTVPVLLNAACVAHVERIDSSYRPARNHFYRISSSVSIFDQGNAPVSGAGVWVEVKLPNGTLIGLSGVTDTSGITNVFLYSAETGGYCFKVIQVRKQSWIYDPTQNVETKDCVTVPGQGRH